MKSPRAPIKSSRKVLRSQPAWAVWGATSTGLWGVHVCLGQQRAGLDAKLSWGILGALPETLQTAWGSL